LGDHLFDVVVNIFALLAFTFLLPLLLAHALFARARQGVPGGQRLNAAASNSRHPAPTPGA
jgi:hypothetical protein